MKLNLGLMALALALGFLWFRSHDAAIRADERAKLRGDSLQAALATGDSLRAALAATARRLDSASRIQARDFLILKHRTMSAQQRADSTSTVLDSVLASLPDTVPLARAITNERIAGASCRLALSSCDSLGALLTAEVANRDSVIALLEPANQRLREVLKETERRVRRRIQFRPGAGGCLTWSPGDGILRAAPCAFFGIVF